MGRIGNFGKYIVFETSDERVLNFTGFTRSTSASWATHERMKKKPQAEWLHPDLQQITFTINLNSQLGVKPRATLESIDKCIEKGKVAKLVIGGKKLGKKKWRITKKSETWQHVYDRGELSVASCNLTLEEYL